MNDELKKRIIQDFGLAQMATEEQEKFIERIGNMLFESVIERALKKMDESAMSEFDELLNDAGEDYQKVIAFLRNRAPGFKDIVTDEMARLKRATSSIFA
ncbi:MAG: DUF5663 domain-containing protein [Patescibacteria group bacterium]